MLTDGISPPLNGLTFSLNMKGLSSDIKFYEELPPKVKNSVDNIARGLLDPESGHVLVLGFNSSGKSFLIDQFASNVDRYLENSKLDNLNLIEVSRADAVLIENIPNGVTQYVDACSAALKTKPENLCLVTESPDFAAAVYSHSKEIKIILELNIATFLNLETREMQGSSKIWSSWSRVDANEIFLSREELNKTIASVMGPKLSEHYNVDIDENTVHHMVDHFLVKSPELSFTEDEDDVEVERVILPPGFWGLAVKKLASSLAYSSNPALLNKNGEKDICCHINSIVEEMMDEVEKIMDLITDDHEMAISLPFGIPGGNVSVIHMGSPAHAHGQEEEEDDYDTSPLVFSDISTLDKRLKKTIFGQDEPVSTVVDSLIVPAAGLHDATKPIRSFLFLGPTGVGKTQLSLDLAREVADEPMNVIRLDMSEYSEAHEASKLFGSAAGYVGHEEGGILTNAVRNHPKSLLLLDEAEKAHPRIWDQFLQVLDAGRMTDNKGVVVDFSRVILVMTSNLGAKESNDAQNLGFFGQSSLDAKKRQVLTAEVEKFFKIEFINRIDNLVYFNTLSLETAREIVKREITIVGERMKPSGLKLSKYEDDVVDEILSKSSFTKYGARDIERAVLKNISQPLARVVLTRTNSKKYVKLSLSSEKQIQVK